MNKEAFEEVLLGDLCVTRCPCLHPGDIRLLKGVNKPELAHLYNVVVFSSKGERPACNMMAGGDLDGDVYFVAWDKQMMSHLNPSQMVAPAIYEKPTDLTKKPAGSEIADYMCFYFENDCLGMLSNLHLAISDQEGPTCDDAIYLASLASVAVDFAKHGECVSYDKFKSIKKQIEETYGYPDFMEKRSKSVDMIGKSILSKLYQQVELDQARQDFIQADWHASVKFDYKLDQEILDLCVDTAKMHSFLKECYLDIVQPMTLEMKQIMVRFHLLSEAELYTSDFYGDMFLCSNSQSSNLGERKSEEIQTALKTMIDRFNDVVSQKFEESGDPIAVSVALYLSSYLDQNSASLQYFKKHKTDVNLNHFCTQVLGSHTYSKQFRDELLNFDKYKEKCLEALKSFESHKLSKLLSYKKYLSPVWVL